MAFNWVASDHATVSLLIRKELSHLLLPPETRTFMSMAKGSMKQLFYNMEPLYGLDGRITFGLHNVEDPFQKGKEFIWNL